MKKTTKLILLLLLTFLFGTSIVALAACNQQEDPSEFVQQQGNTIQVVLNSTLDPLIKDSVDKMSNGYIDYRLKSGSPIPQPGVTSGTSKPVLEGFIFDGYYECSLDANGNVVYLSQEKWDFSTKVTENVTLYGKWLIQYKIHINYVLDGQVQSGQSADVDVIGNAASVESILEPTWANHTFVQMYTDPECQQELNVSSANPFTHGCTQDNPVRDVYAKFIDGRWTLVRSASDMLRIGANDNLYLMNDIDMSSEAKDGYTDITVTSNFVGMIEGNGHMISNLNYLREGKDKRPIDYTTYCFGLFAQISGATIRNITFVNCTISGTVKMTNTASDEYYYGFIAGRVQGDSKFENINFVNCQLKPLKFEILGGISAEDEATERAKIECNIFVGSGSDYSGEGITYQPNAVEQAVASLAKLVLSGK